MANNTENLLAKVIGYTIGIFLIPAAFYWYNHVLYWRQLTYWQWFIIAIGWIIAAWWMKPIRRVMALVFVVCILAQFMSFAGVITLPLIKPA